jgi:hypothetical protein
MKNKASNTNKEVYALSRVLYMLDEYSITYLAEQNAQFDSVVQQIYADVNKSIQQLAD